MAISKRASRKSSGLRRQQRANQERRRLTMKVARWERYKKEIESGSRKGKAADWDTSKMEKRIDFNE